METFVGNNKKTPCTPKFLHLFGEIVELIVFYPSKYDFKVSEGQ